MPIDDFKDDDEKTVLEIVNENLVEPLFSAPVQTVQVTTRTIEYVGSRSKLHFQTMQQMSLSLLDARERDKTYG